MQSQNRIFDDLVKMMNGVAGTMAGVGREAEVVDARQDARMGRRNGFRQPATSLKP